MNPRCRLLLVCLAVLSILAAAQGVCTATEPGDESAEAQRWVTTHLAGRNGEPDQIAPAPFSFAYGGRASAELLKSWTVSRQQTELDAQRTEHRLCWTDSDSGLEVRCVAVVYHDFPTVEWTVYFRNGGQSDTPLLENIQALDSLLGVGSDGDPVVHHFKGALAEPDDYRPRRSRTDALHVASGRRGAHAADRPAVLER